MSICGYAWSNALEHRQDGVGIGEVAADPRAAPPEGDDLLRGLLHPRHVDVADEEVRPGIGERQRRGVPDAPIRPGGGHQRDTPGQIEPLRCHQLLLRRVV